MTTSHIASSAATRSVVKKRPMVAYVLTGLVALFLAFDTV
jgi:hypothetical protein